MNNEILENSEEKVIIQTLIRSIDYLNEFYQIREKVEFHQNYEKVFALSRDQNLNVVISKQTIDFTNKNLNERVSNMIKFLENNLVLLENLWISQEFIDTEINESKFNLMNIKCENPNTHIQSN
jgi:hypothetical protein